MANTCMICGAIIGENNTTNIGGGCMANIVMPAKWDCFWQIKGLDLWVAKAQFIRGKFLTQFDGVKFRSEFRKSFYSSMQTAERLSKKQVEVMRKWLDDAHVFLKEMDLLKIRDEMFEKFDPHMECEELHKERIAIHKKLYLSGRKDQKEAA